MGTDEPDFQRYRVEVYCAAEAHAPKEPILARFTCVLEPAEVYADIPRGVYEYGDVPFWWPDEARTVAGAKGDREYFGEDLDRWRLEHELQGKDWSLKDSLDTATMPSDKPQHVEERSPQGYFTYRLTCKLCGDDFKRRDDAVHVVLDRLRDAGVPRISVHALRCYTR